MTSADHPAGSGPAVPGRGVQQLGQGQFDLTASVGGVRGLLESIAPGLVFVVVFVATRDLTWSLIGAGALAVVAALSRLISRSSLNYVFGGLVGVGIGTVWAWRTGQAEDFFVWGLYVNAIGVLVALGSILARRPLVGVLVGALMPGFGQWRQDRAAVRILSWATALWVLLFGLRLGVQLPLYLNAQVGWLGTARLVMGVPLWAVVLYLTWLLVHPLIKASRQAQDEVIVEAPEAGSTVDGPATTEAVAGPDRAPNPDGAPNPDSAAGPDGGPSTDGAGPRP
ncbi:DUF3159 domain-containing protein [Pseudactinotalea sp. Z1748]|uniref:DUF3159 domain-containing protein n=1 Tax=Pseudactinotalea sp. Z1748 TaxID=3413027 RepID=UPI003C7C36BC